jgi:DNA-binding GntR family transcriptional regulator
MEPRELSAAQARALGVTSGSLGIRIVRRYFDAKGRIFEHAVSVQGGDESRLTMMIRTNRPG